MEGLTIEKINNLQAENDRLRAELDSRNKMLLAADLQNKKLSEQLILTQGQYNKVVEQNKKLQQKIKGLNYFSR